MSFLLFLIAIGLATATGLLYQQLQKSKEENKIAQQRTQETNNKLQAIDRKYGGLISQEEEVGKLQSHTEWTVSGSKKEGRRMVDSFLKLVLRAFNGECDAAVGKVKYNPC